MQNGFEHYSLGERSADWEKLRLILNKIDERGLASLSENELSSLPGLYRKTLSDLSLFRTKGNQQMLVGQLSHLCNKAHGIIYSDGIRQSNSGFLKYVMRELPCALRRNFRLVLASAAIMTFCAVIGWIHCQVDDNMAMEVLGPDMINQYKSSLQAAHDQSELGLATQIGENEKSSMALMITVNNIGVSVRAFLFGILGGIPAILIIAFNGYMLGAIAFLYFNTPAGLDVNLPMYFLAGVFPHGTIELPAITLAGAAGMKIGFAWLFPGNKLRLEAMRESMPDAMKLVVLTALTLIVAGAIEGFITPIKELSGMPLETLYGTKIVFGSLVFVCWTCWLYFGSRD